MFPLCVIQVISIKIWCPTFYFQSKDKLISSLKEGSVGGSDAAIWSAELEELRGERDLLREELQQAQMTLDNMRTELSDLEIQVGHVVFIV